MTSLQLLQSVFHQETPLSSEASENRFEPGPDCTVGGQSLIPSKRSVQILGENGRMESGIVKQQQTKFGL